MSRMKTIGWLLLVIIVIGVVAILARTPVRSDTRSPEEAAAPVAADTSQPDDTASADSAALGEAAGDQNSSQ